jgi:CRP/FNR family transcriptional regulator
MSAIKEKYNISERLKIPFEHVLSLDQKEKLELNLNTVKYRKKDIIFRQDTRASHIMFVKSGLVKVYKEGRSGRSIILKVAREGDFIGIMSVFGEKIHQYSAAALNNCEICDIDDLVLRSVLIENGKFGLEYMNMLSTDGLFIFKRLMDQSHKQLPGRVADVLLYFSREVFQSEKFVIPLTRKELADFSGTTKESFIRTLTEFKNDKIIEIDGSSIYIKSMDIVRTLSNLG